MVDVMQRNASIEISEYQLSRMAELVKKSLDLSVKALFESNILLARNVIEADKAINSYEIDIDNSTYGMLVVNPIPPDILRSIISIQKINAMLERIGDHAVNIAESAINLAGTGGEKIFFDLPDMADQSKKMFYDALSSFFDKDVGLADDVLGRDDTIDSLNLSISAEVKAKVLANELSFESAMDLIRVCKNFERIADLSSNIAEETSFAVMGRIVKHHYE
ncbi:MAG: phosphate signaling complex protein PhoU [Chitinispirillaceae bacterium]|jgi:phosphate transport system protein